VRRLLAAGAAALALVGCASAPPVTDHGDRSIEALASAVQGNAQQLEHEKDAHVRAALIAQSRDDADACLAARPLSGACHYLEAIALGMQAREHPAHVGPLLTQMLENLERAQALEPAYDSAGPARVRALVLARAPGWPLGPGDPVQAIGVARSAVALRPDYPPNWLALAEAQAKGGAPTDALDSYARARAAASALPDSSDRAQWLGEAERGIKRAGNRQASRDNPQS